MKKVFITCILLSLGCIICNAQDSLYIDLILQRIKQQQTISDPYFIKGIFPSFISKKQHYSEDKKDNNVFYNGLIGYTLNYLEPYLSPINKQIADTIRERNQLLFQRFKNKKGRNTYNFSRTDTAFTFPYTNWISKLRGNLEFPDDLDCTVILLMNQCPPDSVTKEVHDLMQKYVNKRKLKTTFSSYRKYNAYSSWYGKKFPVVFDVSVLCNVLCFVQENHLQWTHADSASLQLIIHTINNNDHINHPAFVSPYYGQTSIILYHLARLMCVKPLPELEVLKPKLAEDAKKIISKSKNNLEKIMLNSALMKWGYQPVDPSFKSYEELIKEIHNSDFSFFVANIPSYQKQPFKELLTDWNVLQFYYYCNAFNDALLLEYLVLKNKTKK